MQITSTKQFFDTLLPAALAKFPAEAKNIGGTYHFKVQGTAGGAWTVNLAGPTCVPGIAGNSDFGAVISSDSDFLRIAANPSVAMSLYFQGKLLTTGDIGKAGRIANIVKLVEKA